MSPAASAHFRSDLVAAILTGIWLIVWRAMLGTPWGFYPSPMPGGSMIDVGILYNPGDTWSYLSWAQQYFHGSNLAGLLYTTEPNTPLLWIFPLWLVGKIAALLGLPILGVYNASGLIGAMTAVVLFRRAARALSLSSSACNWVTVALVLGSGSSWLSHLIRKFHPTPTVVGGDMFYFDLFPSTTFLTYAYHAVGLALLAGVWWIASESENRWNQGGSVRTWILALVGVALLLSFSRPYEPVAFLGAWLLKTAWHGGQRKRFPRAWHTSLRLAVILGLAIAPGLAWNIWITLQPGWSNFAQATLMMEVSRAAWIWTLVGGAPLIGWGAVALWHHDRHSMILPFAATLLFGFILLGPVGGVTKMASGLVLGPILLMGMGTAHLIHTSKRLPHYSRVPLLALGLSAMLGVPSYCMALNAIILQPPTLLDAKLLPLIDRLSVPPGHPPFTVLTDSEMGTILPGLVGAKVWVGHWSLSPHYEEKVGALREGGLDPSHPPGRLSDSNARLASIVSDANFDRALIDRRCDQSIRWLEQNGWEPVLGTSNYLLLQPKR